jgi:outer membrane protein OmpA-like peptidoglycan-associated protein
MAADLQATLKSGRAAAANLERLLGGVDKGDGPLGALLGGDGSNSIGSTLREAHSAVVQMNEVLAAAKSNFLLRGYFVDRGYWTDAELEKHQLDEPITARVQKEYTFNMHELFDKGKFNARLKKTDPLYAIGVFLMSQPHSLVGIRVYVSEVGKSEENLQMSRARAFVIREYLTKNFPVEELKIKIKGYGETEGLPLPPERGAGDIKISIYE